MLTYADVCRRMLSDLRTALVLGCMLPCIPTDPLGIGDDVVLGGGDPLATVAALVAGGAKGFVVDAIHS